ncbi:MAG: hypothetical protein EON54_25275 [Alcaligenaceae bacterium]|nr:MAG: hypothetical protein EON54_25275 [Alcaligenaceae bacterium]
MSDINLPTGFKKSVNFEESAEQRKRNPTVRAVAFYLPQFHPTAENDLHWGKGFTEWSNVARATAEFTGHHQPRAPRDFGYYDLRLSSVQQNQAQVAEAAGVAAFCYYYYWFDGQKPLMVPIQNHESDNAISLPFCLCFANENWTKKWDGHDSEVIFLQKYGQNFARRFWDDLVEHLKSPKYLTDDAGSPYLLVYRPSLIPDFLGVVETNTGSPFRNGPL